jgi:hypothetical protein
MAIQHLARRTCDRCKDVIEETPKTPGDTIEKSGDVLVAEFHLGDFAEAARFTDLCQSCRDRVNTLWSQLLLKKEAKDDKTPEPGDTGGAGTTKKVGKKTPTA